jgi:hypothetical protein
LPPGEEALCCCFGLWVADRQKIGVEGNESVNILLRGSVIGPSPIAVGAKGYCTDSRSPPHLGAAHLGAGFVGWGDYCVSARLWQSRCLSFVNAIGGA